MSELSGKQVKSMKEAYASIYSNQIRIEEEKKYEEILSEYVDYIFINMLNEGYDITEEEVRQFCLDEGIPGMGAVQAFFSGTQKAAQKAAKRQQALARLKRIKANQDAENAEKLANIQKAGEKVGSTYKALTSKKAVAAGTVGGTAEFVGSGQATGDGKSIAAGIPASIVGGVGNILKQGGRPLSAFGYPGIEAIGGELKKAGSWMAGGDTKKNKSNWRDQFRPTSENNSYEMVKGHLLDEGYAESEKEALAIMANMSEEWRQAILNSIKEDI